MSKWRRGILGILAALASCSAPDQGDATPVPKAVPGEGLKNTFEVCPDVLRGGQPTQDGMKSLEAQGVRTVINLRAEASDAEAAEGRALKVVDVPMKSWKAEPETIVAFLRAVKQARSEGKCFFH